MKKMGMGTQEEGQDSENNPTLFFCNTKFDLENRANSMPAKTIFEKT